MLLLPSFSKPGTAKSHKLLLANGTGGDESLSRARPIFTSKSELPLRLFVSIGWEMHFCWDACRMNRPDIYCSDFYQEMWPLLWLTTQLPE